MNPSVAHLLTMCYSTHLPWIRHFHLGLGPLVLEGAYSVAQALAPGALDDEVGLFGVNSSHQELPMDSSHKEKIREATSL